MKRWVASLSVTLMGLMTTLSASTLARELSIHPQLKSSSPGELRCGGESLSADRPSIFLIWDRKSGSILFLGR
jgi:hypothetical protein